MNYKYLDMKNILNKITFLFFIFAVFALNSCGTDDSQKEWGIAKIYMPQAAIFDGGITNNYPVPLNNNPSTKNYDIDTATNLLHIYLGVYRSGLQPLNAYSVKVYVDEAATNDALAGISKGVALPSDVYSLPSEVAVKDNERQATFYLTVDLNKLEEKYMDYATKKMVLVVGISDPSNYSLNESLSKTTVIIDGSSFLPAPKIVPGGDFSAGSEVYWTLRNLNNSGVFNPSVAVIQNGVLTMTFGAGPVSGNIAFYQPINLTKGTKYKLSCDFSSTGGAKDGKFFICISTIEPQTGQDYDMTVGIFTTIDSWQPAGITNAVSGKLPQIGTWQSGDPNIPNDPYKLDKTTGQFSPPTDGQYYIILVIAAYNGNVSTITLDNLKIEEI